VNFIGLPSTSWTQIEVNMIAACGCNLTVCIGKSAGVCADEMAHPTRFERLTFAAGGRGLERRSWVQLLFALNR
jgi:hypothetical protein